MVRSVIVKNFTLGTPIFSISYFPHHGDRTPEKRQPEGERVDSGSQCEGMVFPEEEGARSGWSLHPQQWES